MKKTLTSLTAILLSVLMLFTLASCNSDDADGDATEFVAATISVGQGIPVSEAEIISFYNDIITKVQKSDTFTAANKPGVSTNESLYVDDIQALAYDAATGETTETEALKALNSSASAIKDRILSGIDTSIPVVPFGDMNTSISSVIYPYNSDTVTLTADDVLSAHCSVDGSNLNIDIILNNSLNTVQSVFGTRDKAALLDKINSFSNSYAHISDYTVEYLNDDENNRHCTINLSVEVEKQEDNSYVCTGRITNLRYSMAASVEAAAECKGSFAEHGDIRLRFRFTDEKSYSFDWFGTATWEPTSQS